MDSSFTSPSGVATPPHVRTGLRLVHILHLDGPGGGPKTVFNHVSYYRHFFDVTVLHGGTGYLASGCEALRVPHFELPLARKSSTINGFFSLIWHLRQIKPDIVLLHGQWAAPVGALAARLCGVRKIVYVCHWASFYSDWTLLRIIRNYLCEWIPCRFSDAVVALSAGNKYLFQIRFPWLKNRLHLIPNSFDPLDNPNEHEAEQIRKENGWTSDMCHVVSVGRLASQKRLDWLLEAWHIVQKEKPAAWLWIVGDGEERENLEKLAAKLNLTNFTFLGSKPRAWAYIKAADLVAMSSMYEGHANVPLEAMSCGVPIVANSVDGVKESFTDGVEGYLVPPANADLFATRLLELIKNPVLRQSMGQAGSLHVQKYTKGPILRRFLNLLLNLSNE